MEDGKIVIPGNYQASSQVSETVRNRIDQWIKANELNQFGDPIDSVYLGGNPLFDETTGITMDRYEYILSKNPELGEL